MTRRMKLIILTFMIMAGSFENAAHGDAAPEWPKVEEVREKGRILVRVTEKERPTETLTVTDKNLRLFYRVLKAKRTVNCAAKSTAARNCRTNKECTEKQLCDAADEYRDCLPKMAKAVEDIIEEEAAR